MKIENTLPFDLLEKVIDDNCFFTEANIKELPLIYRMNFSFYRVHSTFKFIYIIPNSIEIPSELVIGAYRKITSSQEIAIVFLYDSSNSNKKVFKESHVNFISIDGDCSLFTGKTKKNTNTYLDRFIQLSYTKLTQLLINYYLTNDIKEYSVREIAERLNFSYSSVSRANSFLHDIGAIKKVGINTGARYSVKTKKELFERAEPYFLNPITSIKKYYLNSIPDFKSKTFSSGDQALMHYSDLAVFGDVVEIAVSKDNFNKICEYLDSHININKNSDYEIALYVEEFLYDPKYFADDNFISLLDTYIITSKRYVNADDPRISSALKSIKKSLTKDK